VFVHCVSNRGMDRGYVAHASSAAEVSLMRIGSWIIEESFVCFWHGAEALPPGVGLRAPRPQGSVVRGQREGHRLQQTYWVCSLLICLLPKRLRALFRLTQTRFFLI
jgi:hypothetical protein